MRKPKRFKKKKKMNSDFSIPITFQFDKEKNVHPFTDSIKYLYENS